MDITFKLPTPFISAQRLSERTVLVICLIRIAEIFYLIHCFTFFVLGQTGSALKNKTLSLELITAVADGGPISPELSIKHDGWSLIKKTLKIN